MKPRASSAAAREEQSALKRLQLAVKIANDEFSTRSEPARVLTFFSDYSRTKPNELHPFEPASESYQRAMDALIAYNSELMARQAVQYPSARKESPPESGADGEDEIDERARSSPSPPAPPPPPPPEVKKAPACAKCASAATATNPLVRCEQCQSLYHGPCQNVPEATWQKIVAKPAGWRCVDCKLCEVCRTSSSESVLLCDSCDRGFHGKCCDPPEAAVPTGAWICPDCVLCKKCGRRRRPGTTASARWWDNYTTCQPCHERWEKKLYCPVCEKIYADDTPDPMVCCESCDMWVHTVCDNITSEQYRRMGRNKKPYYCPGCRAKLGQS